MRIGWKRMFAPVFCSSRGVPHSRPDRSLIVGAVPATFQAFPRVAPAWQLSRADGGNMRRLLPGDTDFLLSLSYLFRTIGMFSEPTCLLDCRDPPRSSMSSVISRLRTLRFSRAVRVGCKRLFAVVVSHSSDAPHIPSASTPVQAPALQGFLPLQ